MVQQHKDFFENSYFTSNTKGKPQSSALADSLGMSRKLIFHITTPPLLEAGGMLQILLWILSMRLNNPFLAKAGGHDLIPKQGSAGEPEW